MRSASEETSRAVVEAETLEEDHFYLSKEIHEECGIYMMRHQGGQGIQEEVEAYINARQPIKLEEDNLALETSRLEATKRWRLEREVVGQLIEEG
ncbi:hypothetical protein FNV43_RR20307 [Rhamnella rubrinervis]|uniref:Uncharacterized protein n=1 Tax=Rhamnella rubrinervis TaxID=2594499 RepID=A0A8K0DU61_9ROSA|nr:hypothetical protein FNV43_RR20307 [Rhamnella rubrinervis]